MQEGQAATNLTLVARQESRTRDIAKDVLFEEELKALQNVEKENKEPGAVVSQLDLFKKGIYLKPLAISLALNFFYQFGGINYIFFNLQNIFSKAGSDLDPGLSGTIVALVQVKWR